MYGYEDKTYNEVLTQAVNNIEEINQAVDAICEKGYKNLYLVGTGGTYAMASPLSYLIKTNSTIPWYYEIAAELVTAKPKQLTKDSVVITASLSGTTVETINAAKYAKEVGATVIALVGEKECPLAEYADYVFENRTASNDNLVEEIYIQYFALGARFMKNNGEFPEYEKFIDALKQMPEVLQKVREDNDERALAFAEKHKDTKFHMCIGAGNTWGETYCFAMCVLEEMQWIKTKSIHAAEYFHGTLELVEEDTSLILFYGEDETRPLMDRVKNFSEKVTKVINIVESNGDSVINDFGIILDANSEYSFVAESDTQRLRFIGAVRGDLHHKSPLPAPLYLWHYTIPARQNQSAIGSPPKFCRNRLTRKLGGVIMMTRKLGRGGSFMEKKDILEISRREHQNRDLAELEASVQAGNLAGRVGAGVCCLVSALFVRAVHTVLLGPWVIYFSILGTHALVKFLKLKRKTDLVLTVLYLVMFLLFLVFFIRRLMEAAE